ncbi:MAG: thioredoxin-disulfide reductase [Anaerolineales bacterium]|nr:thioredoxin-disulfide reductase [Anaerolineales bacterium]
MMDFNLKPVASQPDQNSEKHVKVLILGTGPAGLSAALYAARADLNPVVLTGMELGGQVSLTYTVENYPGFPDGVSGTEMVELFQRQAEKFGAVVEYDTAIKADLSRKPFRIETYNTVYLADTLIVTTGATPRHLEIPGERELTGRGVSYCATCDGWFFKGKEVIVVGGGDSAVEEAIFLTRYADSVTIVHRRDELRAGPILQERAFDNPKIKFIWDSVLTEIVGEDAVRSIRLQNLRSGAIQEMRTDGVFIFIGHTPNTQLFEGQLTMDAAGYIITDKLMRTNIRGVFAAGEAADPVYRQVVTSAGMGAAAAIQANHYLDEIAGETSPSNVALKRQ